MEWFRFYHKALLDRKVQELSPAHFKTWVNLLCLASMEENDGELPEVKDIAYILRMKPSECEAVTAHLRTKGLLDLAPSGRYIPHNWAERQRKSDASAPRVARHRERKAAIQAESVEPSNVTSNVTGNVSSNTHVTPVTLLEERRGEEIRREREENSRGTAHAVGATSAPSAPSPAPSSQVTPSHDLPERAPDETDLAYWQRAIKGARTGGEQIAILVRLANEKIGAPTDAYPRIGKLAKERGAALLAKDILAAAAQHIDGDPLGYLTALINRSKMREENGANGRTAATRVGAGQPKPSGASGTSPNGLHHGRYADVFKRATPPGPAASGA